MFTDGKVEVRKITSDFVFNFIATALPLIILSLLIYPRMANLLGIEKYGIALSVIGYYRMCSGIFISNLGYNRLLEEKNRVSNGIKHFANYNFLLLLFTFFTFILTYLVINIMNIQFSLNEYVLLFFAIVFFSLDSYLSIEFRIFINYKKVLINKIFLVTGYICGLFFNIWGGSWIFVFLVGQLFATLYDLFATDIWKDTYRVDNDFKKVFIAILTLSIASLIASISTYFDKLLLFPKLGGGAVAIFATTAIIAKIVPNTTGALGNVLLSYFVKMKKFSNRRYMMFILVILILTIIGYIFSYFLSIYFLEYFYPQIYLDCLVILKPVIIIYMSQVFVTLLFPYILCYCQLNIQIVLQSVRLGLYLLFTLPLMYFYGLNGFTYGVLIASLGYVIIMILIGLFSSNT